MTSILRSIPTRSPPLRSIPTCYTQGCFSTSSAVRTFTTTPVAQKGKSSRSASSSRYLERQASDPFVRSLSNPKMAISLNLPPDIANTQFISRSAYKLYHIEDRTPFLLRNEHGARKTRVILDLGASPGGWTQMAWHLINKQKRRTTGPALPAVKLISLDLLPLHESVAARTDVDFLQGDFLQPEIQRALGDKIAAWRTQEEAKATTNTTTISSHVDAVAKSGHADETTPAPTTVTRRADVILSDMMANTTDSQTRNSALSYDLLVMLYHFALSHLVVSRSSYMVLKVFQSAEAEKFRAKYLRPAFDTVAGEKVGSSRTQSREVYWMCRGFRGGFPVREEDL